MIKRLKTILIIFLDYNEGMINGGEKMASKRAQERNRRLKALYSKTRTKYYGGVFYDRRKNRLIKYNVSNTTARKFRSKVVRNKIKKSNMESLSGAKSWYKKLYDYKWELL